MSDIKVTLIVEVEGHILQYVEEVCLSPIGHLPSAHRVVERYAIKAQNRAVRDLIRLYGEG